MNRKNLSIIFIAFAASILFCSTNALAATQTFVINNHRFTSVVNSCIKNPPKVMLINGWRPTTALDQVSVEILLRVDVLYHDGVKVPTSLAGDGLIALVMDGKKLPNPVNKTVVVLAPLFIGNDTMRISDNNAGTTIKITRADYNKILHFLGLTNKNRDYNTTAFEGLFYDSVVNAGMTYNTSGRRAVHQSGYLKAANCGTVGTSGCRIVQQERKDGFFLYYLFLEDKVIDMINYPTQTSFYNQYTTFQMRLSRLFNVR